MILFKMIPILILSSVINCQRAGNISKLIKDIIENERVASVLWATTCWSKIDDFNFVMSLAIRIQIVKWNMPINLPTDENTNKQCFFVDMSCEKVVDRSTFLSTVNEKYFAHPYRWIIADATNESLQNLTFLPDSNIILVNQDLTTNQYILKQGKV